MPTYVVTGANRGIGLGLVKQLAAQGNTVIGTVRDLSKAPELVAIPGVEVVCLEMTDPESNKAAAEAVAKLTGGAIDVLIANAAHYSDTVILNFEAYPSDAALVDDMKKHFEINSIGTVLTINAFLPLLKKGNQKKVIFFTTPTGNATFCKRGGVDMACAYGLSKVAADFAILKYSITHRDEGFIFLSLCPGTATTGSITDLSAFGPMFASFFRAQPGWNGQGLTPEECARACIGVIENLKPEDNGRWITYHGDEETWL